MKKWPWWVFRADDHTGLDMFLKVEDELEGGATDSLREWRQASTLPDRVQCQRSNGSTTHNERGDISKWLTTTTLNQYPSTSTPPTS